MAGIGIGLGLGLAGGGGGIGGLSLRGDSINDATTGTVGQLRTTLKGATTFTKLSGAARVGIGASGDVTVTSPLGAGGSVSFVARVQNAAGDAVERAFMLAAPGTPVVRIVPVSATEAFAIAPHAAFGALALHLMRGNGADTTTPALSVGGGAPGWRIYGFRRLSSIEADPGSGEVIYQGLGSQQYALHINDPANGSLYAGIYHNGVVSFSETVPDLATARMTGAFAMEHAAGLAWPGGQTATVAERVILGSDGSVTTRTVLTCPHDTLDAFPDMTIAGAGFTRAIVDGAAEQNIAAVQDYALGSPARVTLRNPITGTTMTVVDDAVAQAGFVRKFIARKADQSKLYVNFDTPGQGLLGTVTVNRTISFGTTTPDPVAAFAWNGTSDGASGYVEYDSYNQIAFDASARQVVFTRTGSAGGSGYLAKCIWQMGGLTPGQTYNLPISKTIAGSSPSAGCTLTVSTNATGASGTGAVTMSAALTGYGFTATAATMYFVVTQGWSAGTDNVLRITALGPIAAA